MSSGMVNTVTKSERKPVRIGKQIRTYTTLKRISQAAPTKYIIDFGFSGDLTKAAIMPPIIIHNKTTATVTAPDTTR